MKLNKGRAIFAAILLTLCIQPAASAAQLEGYGRNLPLSIAVRQVVPSDTRISYGPGVETEQKVSWEGGKPWRQVLSDMLYAQGLTAELGEGQVFVSKAGAGSLPSPASTDVVAYDVHIQGNSGFMLMPYTGRTALAPPPSSASPAQEVAAATAAGAPMKLSPPKSSDEAPMTPVREEGDGPVSLLPDAMPVASNAKGDAVVASSAVSEALPTPVNRGESWTVEKNALLEDVLYKWATRAGWSIVWRSGYMYPIEAGTTFYGDFEDAAAALFQAMRAEPALYPTFYRGNKVVVVTNSREDTY